MDVSPPTTVELEANLDYVRERSLAINRMLDDMERFDLNPPGHVKLVEYLTTELVINETERQVYSLDLAKERLKAKDH